MRCEEARPLLLRDAHASAESHLEGCDACFAWLEAHDPMVVLLQTARPTASPVPGRVASMVMERWQPHRVSIGLSIAAVVALSAVALILSGMVIAAAPALITSLIAGAGSMAGTVERLVVALLAVPRALLDQPALLTLFVAGTIAVCGLWARLYQQTQIPRRISS